MVHIDQLQLQCAVIYSRHGVGGDLIITQLSVGSLHKSLLTDSDGVPHCGGSKLLPKSVPTVISANSCACEH